eukprot:5050435-Pleurochrysis_carterae.AAC.1
MKQPGKFGETKRARRKRLAGGKLVLFSRRQQLGARVCMARTPRSSAGLAAPELQRVAQRSWKLKIEDRQEESDDEHEAYTRREGRRTRVLSDTWLWANGSWPDQSQRFGPNNRPKDVLKRAHGFQKKTKPKVKNRSTEGQQRAVVKGISRFPAAEGA